MARSTDRRSFLKRVGATAVGSWVAAGEPAVAESAAASGPVASPPACPSRGAQRLSAYAYQSRIWVRIDDQLFACYRAASTQKYPYLYPIVGPATGLAMTEEAGVPYPHHRSVFLACDRVNHGNYWQGAAEAGQIVSRGPSVESDQADGVVITDQCEWRQPLRPPIIEDHRRYTFTAPAAGQRIIDVDVTLAARVDIHVTKTNHSLFAVRAARALAPAGGGVLVNANGRMGEKATFGQVARWCGYYGLRLGRTEAIILMDHRHNPWSPCRWFTRDYGFISPTPFYWLGPDGWRLPAGDSIRLRYRVVVSAGAVTASEMNRLYEAFAASA